MAAAEAKKNWAREIGVTVAGSVIVLVIQNHFGLKDKPPGTPPPLPAPPPAQSAAVPPSPGAVALRHLDRGKEYARAGQHALALGDYTAALRLDPALVEGYARRAWSQLSLGRFEQAAGDYSAALRLDPASSHAYANRGWVYCQLGHYERAIRDCEQALRLDPGLEQAYRVREWARGQQRTFGVGRD
jgi:tetratricopeptide (TPR) repeat protein